MTCDHVTVPGGARAIVCSSRRRQRCGCGRNATLLCDWKVPAKKSGTCDKPLCDRCTAHPEANGRVNFDKDLCPAHAEAFEQWKAEQA